jgi:hypothetical protein
MKLKAKTAQQQRHDSPAAHYRRVQLADGGRQLPLQSWINLLGSGCAVGVRLTPRILGFYASQKLRA